MAPSANRRVLLHAFPTFSFGGQQARFVQLANAFGSRFRHLIVAMDGCFDAGQRLAPSVSWEALPFATVRGGGLANRRAARLLIERVRPHQMLTYNWGAIEWVVANWPRRVAHVHVEDGFGPEEASQQLPRRIWARRILLGSSGANLAVPSATLARLAASWWVRPSRLQFIPNGVPVTSVCPVQHHPKFEEFRKPLVIGTVAGLRREKNIARLVRAFAAALPGRDLKLVIVGDGPERPALEALALSLGIAGKVDFTGYLTEPMARMATFDLFALSSDTEQLPMAMLEAMAIGIPVAATRVGDVSEILPVVAHAGLSAVDDLSFSDALQRVLNLRPQWPAWALAGHKRVSQCYSEASMLSRWQAIYNGRFAEAGPEADSSGSNHRC